MAETFTHGEGTDTAAALRGQAAIANARLAWAAHLASLSNPSWQALAGQGAHPQRPLWASTGVKDPAYADTRYVIDLAVGDTRPDLTLFLKVPQAVSEERLRSRQSTMPFLRDRMEEADRAFFERVTKGYDAIAAEHPDRIKVIHAVGTIEEIQSAIWRVAAPLAATRVS